MEFGRDSSQPDGGTFLLCKRDGTQEIILIGFLEISFQNFKAGLDHLIFEEALLFPNLPLTAAAQKAVWATRKAV